MKSLSETADYYDLAMLDELDKLAQSPELVSEYDRMERQEIRSRLKAAEEKIQSEYDTKEKRQEARGKHLENLMKAFDNRDFFEQISALYIRIASPVAANMIFDVLGRKSELLTLNPRQNVSGQSSDADCAAALQPFLESLNHFNVKIELSVTNRMFP